MLKSSLENQVYVPNNREQCSNTKYESSSVGREASVDASLSGKDGENSFSTACEEPQQKLRTTTTRSHFQSPKPNFRKCSSKLNVNVSKDIVKIEAGIQNDREHKSVNKKGNFPVKHEREASLSAKEIESFSCTGCKDPEQEPSAMRTRSFFQRHKPNFRPKSKFSLKLNANCSEGNVQKQGDVQNDREQNKDRNGEISVVHSSLAGDVVSVKGESYGDTENYVDQPSRSVRIRPCLPRPKPNLRSGTKVKTKVLKDSIEKQANVRNDGEQNKDRNGEISVVHSSLAGDVVSVKGESYGDTENYVDQPSRSVRIRPCLPRPKPNLRSGTKVKTKVLKDSIEKQANVHNDGESSSVKKSASKNGRADGDVLNSHSERNDSLSGVNSRKRKFDPKDIYKEVEAKDKIDKISAIDSDAPDDTIVSIEDESSVDTAISVDSQRKLGTVKIRLHLPKLKPDLKRISTTCKSSTSISKARPEKRGNIRNNRQKRKKESRCDSTNSDEVSPLKERNDSSCEVQSHKRKCVHKTNKECQQKRRPGHKKHNQKVMTILDLVHWNPRENPMRLASSDKVQDHIQGDSSAAVSTKENTDWVTEKQAEAAKELKKGTGANPVRGPQVMIGAKGEITVDKSSLVVHRKVDIENANTAIVCEDGRSTTYTSFRTKPKARVWDVKETKKFYKALSIVGTDFTLMSELFGNRSRRELKLKYKHEERYNRLLVDHALDSSPVYDLEMFRHDGDGKAGDTNNGENAEKPSKTRKQHWKVTEDQNVDVDSDVHQGAARKKKRAQRRSRKKFLVSSSDEDILPAELVPQNETGKSEKTNSYVSANECLNVKDEGAVADGVSSTVVELIVCDDDDIESTSSSNKLIRDEATVLDEKQQILSMATSKISYELENMKTNGCEQSDINAVVEEMLCFSENCVTENVKKLIPQDSFSERKNVLLKKCPLSSIKTEENTLTAYAENKVEDITPLSPVEVVKVERNKFVPSTKGQCPTELNKSLPNVLLSPFVCESLSQEAPDPCKFFFLPRQGPSNQQVMHLFLVKDTDVSQEGKVDNSSCEKDNRCDASKSDENYPNKDFINLAHESKYCVSKCESYIAPGTLNCSQDATNQNAVP